MQWARFSGGAADLGFAPGAPELQDWLEGGGVAVWWDDVGQECGWAGCGGGSEFGAVLWTRGPRRGAAWFGWRKVGKHMGSAEVGSPAVQESMLRAAPEGGAGRPAASWTFPQKPLPACPSTGGRALGQGPGGAPYPAAGGTMDEFLLNTAAPPSEKALTARELIEAARGSDPARQEEVMRVENGCFVGAWNDWGPCSYPCGGGVQSRSRQVFPSRGLSPAQCPKQEESRTCNVEGCNIPGAGGGSESVMCRMFGVDCP